MKKIHYTITFLLLISLFIACGSPKIGSIADMSGYEELDEPDTQVFIVSDVNDFLQRLDNGESFSAYFGFTDCPWCNDAISLLNAEAKSANQTVYYINTRPNRRVTRNSEIPDYDQLVSRVGEYFGLDDTGEPYLFVPFVFFVRDGKVVLTHQGTMEGYEPTMMDLPEEMAAEVQKIYHEGFALINE